MVFRWEQVCRGFSDWLNMRQKKQEVEVGRSSAIAHYNLALIRFSALVNAFGDHRAIHLHNMCKRVKVRVL